ncbi:hypothetical protein ACQKJC_13830 [Priestia koreensis]|uniref:hypothetical protein n=1 Tax=Priestia koreensis TaxID=284581 RepID=UPI003D069D17
MSNRDKSWWYVTAFLFPLVGMRGSGEGEKKSIAIRSLCLSFVWMFLWVLLVVMGAIGIFSTDSGIHQGSKRPFTAEWSF